MKNKHISLLVYLQIYFWVYPDLSSNNEDHSLLMVVFIPKDKQCPITLRFLQLFQGKKQDLSDSHNFLIFQGFNIMKILTKHDILQY